MQMEKVTYGGWDNCIRLSNGEIELIATTAIGPRIIRAGFCGGQNLFCEYPETLGKTGGDDWRLYGGHRLWHAPEVAPRTYWPDNEPVEYDWDGTTLTLNQAVEGTTGIQKQIAITMDDKTNHVELVHRLTNRNLWDIETAPWCLTVFAAKGRAIIPQEDFRPHPEYFLAARPLVLWHYTNMADPRWTWGEKYIQLRQDPSATTKLKLGMLNKQKWAAYYLNGQLLIKKYACDADATYPDYGCNTETFTDSDMLELETLAPMQKLAADGGVAEHTEHWHLHKVEIGDDDAAIDAAVLPLIK